MAWMDDHMVEQATGAHTVREKLKEESTVRVFGNEYFTYREEHGDRRDFSRARVARGYLNGAKEYKGLIESAVDHLLDAANTNIPETVRVEHYDIAQARIWAAINYSDYGDIPVHWVHAVEELIKGVEDD